MSLPFIGSFDPTLVLDNLNEFSKKYRDTFLRIGEKKIVAYCANVEDKIYFTNSKFGEIILNQYTETTLDASFPEPGCFNMDNQAFVFKRVPARQWKKAPCKSNCNIYDPFHHIKANGISLGNYYRVLNEDILIHAFKQRNILSIKKALFILKKEEKRSIALTNDFILSTNILNNNYNKEKYILFFESFPIGFLENSTEHIKPSLKLFNKEFNQEVYDAFKNQVTIYE